MMSTSKTTSFFNTAKINIAAADQDMNEARESRKYPLNQVYFYLTRGCNLRCRHCWIAPEHQSNGKYHSSLDLNLFKSIIGQAIPLGLTGVKLTGGEPLLHPQIQEILELIRSAGLQLTVETNGVLCTSELANKMASCDSPFVSVSLDGEDPETHEWMRGVAGCFVPAVNGIKNLVEAGLRPQVIMSIVRRNKDQMVSVTRLAERLGAGSVKFNVVQPTARGKKLSESDEALNIEELVALGRWVENTLKDSTPLRLYYGHPMAFSPLGSMFGKKEDGCGVCGILGILGVLADGSYALCGIGEAIQDLVFGHASIEALDDIWSNTPILLELRKGLPERLEGICGHCIMKAMCLGSCLAQNYYSSKNIWAPFWFCHEASGQGLFPKTRIQPDTSLEAKIR